MYSLFYAIFATAAAMLDVILGLTIGYLPYGPMYLTLGMVLIVPSFAVNVRRLHDIGKSGWMLLIILIPFVGAIWWIVLTCLDSQTGDNKWGPNPKELK